MRENPCEEVFMQGKYVETKARMERQHMVASLNEGKTYERGPQIAESLKKAFVEAKTMQKKPEFRERNTLKVCAKKGDICQNETQMEGHDVVEGLNEGRTYEREPEIAQTLEKSFVEAKTMQKSQNSGEITQ